MNFSLSNMLSNGGSLNADGLSLDLAFALDKTLTARKGPTPVFTRASTATFIGSNGLIQSAAINVPRFDHDPVTLVCRGLLIEESRQNALLNSDALATQNVTVTAAARTLSFYGTGTVVLSGTHSATVVGTGAFPARRTLTFTPTAGTLTLTVTGTVQFAQLEIGVFSTSYIPTTTAALTRSADVCSIEGANFTSLWNVNEGSTFLSGISAGRGSGLFGNAAFFLNITSSAFNRISQFALDTGSIRYEVFTDSVTQYRTNDSAYTNDTVARLSFGYRSAETSSGFYNSTAFIGGTNIPLTVPNVSSLRIGSAGNSNFCNGTIARIQYYGKRLTDAKLQTLTA